MLGKVDRQIPTMLDYNTHIEKKSSFNTPPVFPIYVCMLVFRWLRENGGLEAMEAHNKKKATILYDTLDSSELFYGVVDKDITTSPDAPGCF